MASTNFIPAINTRGIYSLRAPFQTELLQNTAYSCVAVRMLNDIVAAGGDPKAEYYTPHLLTDEEYEADLAAGVCIVSLQAFEGSVVYVPSSFITKLPDQGGIPYTTVVLAVHLSAIPVSLDLEYLRTRIGELVAANIGVTTTIDEVVVSPETHLSLTEHNAIEAARQALITNRTTDLAKLIAVTAQRDSALQKIVQLEAWIRAHPA